MTRAEKVVALRAKGESTPYAEEAAECFRLADKLEARLSNEPTVGELDLEIDELLATIRGIEWGGIKTVSDGVPYTDLPAMA